MKKRILSLILVFTMCVSLSVGAFAEETSGSGTVIGAVEVETTAGNNETVNVTIEIGSSDNADGTTTTVTESKAEDFVTDSGAVVDYSAKSETITDEEGNTLPGSTSESEYTSTKNDGNYVYNAEGGSDSKVIETTPEMTVDVPTKEGQSNTANGNEVGSTVTTGDVRESEDDGIYDYTTETVIQSGSVTVDNTKVEVKVDAVESEYEDDLQHVRSETNPDGSNDLVHAGDAADSAYLPGYEGETVIPEGVDGYEYVIVGSGNTSKLVPAIVFDTPLSDEQKLEQYGNNAYIKKNSVTWYYVGCLTEEDRGNIAKDSDGNYVLDEEGYLLDVNGNRVLKEELTTTDPDGNTKYLHRFDRTFDGLKVEGWYEDGEWVSELNGSDKYTAVWAGPQQFVLVDKDGNIVTTYCADFSTPTQDVYGYNIENLEDATYYSDEEAKMIRTIVNNGYWGTVGTEIDENGNEVPKLGSLEAMKQMLLASGEFTEAELASLTDGVALTATQMAIWSCSNKMTGIEFVNSHYSNWGVGDVSKDKEDEVKLMFRLYDYLMALEPTDVEDTSAEQVITKDNFIKDMSVSVIEKIEDHVNNTDADSTNDAYTTELKFALVVTPSTENGDDMIVQVIGPNGVEAEARIAGTPKEGETMQYLTPDENGNFTFSGITMIEGNQQFNITLQGIQNLEQGVYLYSSEVRTDDNGEEVPSQTMVGIAGGAHAVNVSMEISFDLNVEDEVVAVEHVWRTEHDPGEDPPQWDPPVPLNDEPEEEIIIEDEAVPLAQAPHTGSGSALYAVMAAMSALGLAGVNLGRKTNTRGKHEL